MGYRSDVCFVAEFEDEAKRDAALVAAKLKFPLDDVIWDAFDTFQQTGIVFEVSQWKWYEDYKDVQDITEMFEDFFFNMFDANVMYTRVGEETDDMEEERYECDSGRSIPDWFHDIYIRRSITTPWG